MGDRQVKHIDKTLGIAAGVIFTVIGTFAFLTNLNRVGAIILVVVGISIFVLAFIKPRNEDSTV